MARRRHTPEHIIRKLREAERMLGARKDLAEVARHFKGSQATYHRWRNQFRGMIGDAHHIDEAAANVALRC